ncbi:hypothetical protein K6U28_16650, partial [Vibrio parahaemolyticus]|nr:hypothetical protein [Vibrio parahaemolyticus]
RYTAINGRRTGGIGNNTIKGNGVISLRNGRQRAAGRENQGTRQKFFTHLHIYSHIHYKRQSVRQLLYAAILENEIQAARRHACIYMTYGL